MGCQIKITGEVGSIVEYRDEEPLNQESFCYLAEVAGPKGAPAFEAGEIADGFKIKWASLNEAIELLENDRPDNLNGKFIQIRDLVFLQEAQKLVDARN